MTEEPTTHEKLAAQHALEASEVTEVLKFFKKYGHLIGYILAALIAAFAITSFRNAKAAQQSATANQLLMNAGSDEELQLIIDTYANTAAAPSALLGLARSAFNQGDYDKAQASYNAFLKDYGNHDMAAIAAYGQAACLEALNQLDAAAAEYQKVADENSGSFVVPMALLNKAKLLARQGKTDAAIQAFEDTIKADSTGTWSAQAETEIAKWL